jgi:hypothetical protein
MLIPIVVGAVLGVLFVLAARAWTRGTGRLVLVVGLLVTALIYVGFALAAEDRNRSLAVEAFGVLLFGLLAWLGLRRSLWWLSIGWLGHVAWDVGLHLDRTLAAVPAWYPLFCVGFDLVVAGYLLGPASQSRPDSRFESERSGRSENSEKSETVRTSASFGA